MSHLTPKKISPFQPVDILHSNEDIESLLAIATKHSDKAWNVDEKTSPLTQTEKKAVKFFKEKVKEYLFQISQGAMCCFCGYDIDEHKGSHDLEHIIAKDGKIHLVFSLPNLALSCKSCNGSKLNSKTTISPICPSNDKALSTSSYYRIIHPHLDNWKDHLYRDKFGRVLSISAAQFSKGSQTIMVCGINRKNGMRLADNFDFLKPSVAAKEDWLQFYRILADHDDEKKKRKYQKFLTSLLNISSDPAREELKLLLAPML